MTPAHLSPWKVLLFPSVVPVYAVAVERVVVVVEIVVVVVVVVEIVVLVVVRSVQSFGVVHQ